MKRLLDAGGKMKKEKCTFGASSITYLGHGIDAKGLYPLKAIVKAIVEAPVPGYLQELKSYLGLLNYFGKFLPNLSSLFVLLNHLTKKGVVYRWFEAQNQAYQKSKQLLLSDDVVLVHFDPSKELILACDASPYMVGSVLTQIMEGVLEHPIEFSSRTLTPAEPRYSHWDKEAFAIVVGVKLFHQYIFERTFTGVTDHKPLLGLLDETKAVPQMVSLRFLRWWLTLAAYNYSLQYKAGN